MDQFLRRENVERFRLLAEEIIADETERERTLSYLPKHGKSRRTPGTPPGLSPERSSQDQHRGRNTKCADL